MSRLFKSLLLVVFFLNGHIAFATPQADAALIVERTFDQEWSDNAKRAVSSSFVHVYSQPLLELGGISIADSEKFAALIPDEDIAPYINKLKMKQIDALVSIYSPEELAQIAQILRLDENATFTDIFSEDLKQRHDGTGRSSKHFAFGLSGLTIIPLLEEIRQTERELNNPVTIAALETDGVLKFSSFTQRQALLRQLSSSENTGSARFIKAPGAD
ncbi:MAG: hypothetical protein ABJ251_23615 [Paracoccaceae bacterium]